MRVCYYELLAVESDATDSQLKKAYRRKALELHPDKNRDDIEAATEKFAEVRAAYEVLSDPQERAWYDSHKNQILREDEDYNEEEDYVEPAIAGTTAEEILRYFDPSLYSKCDDSIMGMYSVIGNLFAKLASEEVSSGKQQGLKSYTDYQDDSPSASAVDTAQMAYPRFGNSKADYASEVRNFYKIWGSFQTVKTFSWKDEYRYSSASDRRTRRAMERENKKFRDQARRDFNETVRSYVAFIKKRDPRVKEGATKFDLERRKKQQQEALLQQQRDRIANLENLAEFKNYEVQDWQKLSMEELEELENQLNDEYSKVVNQSSDFTDDEEEIFECIVCNKNFKSEQQFEAHEQSKRHRKTLQKLQWEMKREGIELGIDNEDDEFETADEFNEESRSTDDQIQQDEYLSVEVNDSIEIPDISDDSLSAGQKDDFLTLEIDDNIEEEIHDDIAQETISTTGKNKKKDDRKIILKQTKVPFEDDDQSLRLDGELAQLRENLEKGLKLINESDDDWDNSRKGKSKKTKKKNKSKAPEDVTFSPTRSETKEKESLVESCAVCKQKFSSRNKLFQHVKATNHATQPQKAKMSKKKNK